MSRRRAVIAAVALAAVAATAGAITAISPGSEAPSAGALEWEGAQRVERVAELPKDRVLIGNIRNASAAPASLVADEIELVDARGHPVESTARFAAAFGHALYSPTAAPEEVAELEQIRLGEVAEIPPGGSAPLTLSWRLDGGGQPVAAEVGGFRLALPGG